eukprot:gene8317-5829_t
MGHTLALLLCCILIFASSRAPPVEPIVFSLSLSVSSQEESLKYRRLKTELSRAATVNFYPTTVLPALLLEQLKGRRVTVLLSLPLQDEELEGDLSEVDQERGDLLLENAVHYRWRPSSDGGDAAEESCSGGGSKCVVRRCKAVMVNSKYIDVITPSVFAPTTTAINEAPPPPTANSTVPSPRVQSRVNELPGLLLPTPPRNPLYEQSTLLAGMLLLRRHRTAVLTSRVWCCLRPRLLAEQSSVLFPRSALVRLHRCMATTAAPTRRAPNAAGGLFLKTLELEAEGAPALACAIPPALDLFAQSRITNYVKRITSGALQKRVERVALAKKMRGADALVRVDVVIPVDVLFQGALERSQVTASGLAATERDALIAACMHAERCLDAAGVQLFSAEGRQRKRAEELRQSGRWAPLPQDAPSELAEVLLPPPVCYAPALAEEAAAGAAPGLPVPHSAKRNARMAGEQPFQPAQHPSHHTSRHGGVRRRQRSKDFSRRYGSDPFASMQGTANEMNTLYRTILQHQAAADADEDDDDVPVSIEAHEIEILQPAPRRSPASSSGSSGSAAPMPSPRPSPGSMGFIGAASHASVGKSYYIPSHWGCVDETEGGAFKLVDVSVDKWLPESKNPIAVCIRDATVHERLRDYWAAQPGGLTFDACITVRTAEEETNVQQKQGRWGRVLMPWFTVTLKVPGLGGDVEAVGKATTLDAARDLCAMHMEELLNFFGVPLTSDPEKQMLQFDGCLRWGRCAAPSPIPVQKGLQDANLPKPNKEWYVPRKARMRVSSMTITEKLQALNRRVVSQYRQHHVEVDLQHLRQYDDVLAQSPACLRDFMRAQQHPFEGAIMNFHLAPNEYRASVYLPLPAEYGVRGGCAVGRSQEVAYHLAAMNALDVLFVLDCVPPALLQTPRFEVYTAARRSLGMILPAAVARPGGAPPSPSLRSPPGIRDSPNSWCSAIPPSEEVWRALMTNAEDFDVAPNPTHVPELQGLEVVPLLRRLFTRYMHHTKKRAKDPKEDLAAPHPSPLKCLRHYCGYQHQNGLRRVRANNCWMELPLESAAYGRRIAYGRCLSRNGAERSFYVHAFRILRSLGLAPWDTMREGDLRELLYYGDDTAMRREVEFWRLLVRHVLDPNTEEQQQQQQQRAAAVPQAELLKEEGEGLPGVANTPTPNPVMTPQLAALTLL